MSCLIKRNVFGNGGPLDAGGMECVYDSHAVLCLDERIVGWGF